MPRGLAALVIAWVVGCDGSAPPAIPSVDPEDVEPPVAAKIANAREGVHANPRSATAWGALGMVFQAHDLQRPARQCYDRAIALDPADYRWPYLAALTLWKEDVPRALDYFERSARLDPPNPVFHLNHADTLIRAGLSDEAARSFAVALAQSPGSIHALTGLARAAVLGGDDEAAMEHLGRAEIPAGQGAEVHQLLAQLHLRAGREDEAARAERLARTLAETPRPADPVADAMLAEAVSKQAILRRAAALADAGMLDRAETLLLELVRRSPDEASVHVNLGNVRLRKADPQGAIEALEHAVRLAPDNVNALNNLGLASMRVGDLDGAVERLSAAVLVDPSVAGTHYNLGLVHRQRGELGEAISAFEEALRIDPAYAPVHTALGSALAETGRQGNAVASWRRALELDPKDQVARLGLARAALRAGRRDSAIALLREGVEVDPKALPLVSLLAWQLASAPDPAQRDPQMAVELAQRVYGADPSDPSSADLLGASLAAAGRFEQALRLAERALQSARDRGDANLVAEIEGRLVRYRRGQPYTQPR